MDGLADVPVVVSHADVLGTGSKHQSGKAGCSFDVFDVFDVFVALTMNGVWCPRARKRSPSPWRMLIIPEK